jgi:LysR family transcriptional regulator, transcriptional activator of the cysJI operon
VQLGIVGAEAADERIQLEPFLDDELVGIAKPGLLPLADGKLKPSQLVGLLLLTREPGSNSRRFVERELEGANARPLRCWELGATEAIKRAAREGLGIAILSRTP